MSTAVLNDQHDHVLVVTSLRSALDIHYQLDPFMADQLCFASRTESGTIVVYNSTTEGGRERWRNHGHKLPDGSAAFVGDAEHIETARQLAGSDVVLTGLVHELIGD